MQSYTYQKALFLAVKLVRREKIVAGVEVCSIRQTWRRSPSDRVIRSDVLLYRWRGKSLIS